MPGDTELRDMIREALRLDGRLSEQPVEVSVDDGVVVLEGAVQSYKRKVVAEEIASSFNGCRDIRNRLSVQPVESRSDEDIVAQVRAALESHADITKDVLTVAVSHGVVELGGNVSSLWERVLAEDVALGVYGVRDVRNLTLVDPVSKRRDEELVGDIQSAIDRRIPNIRVAVSGGHVVLSGSVLSMWQKQSAESLVWGFPVLSVRNDITVESDLIE